MSMGGSKTFSNDWVIYKAEVTNRILLIIKMSAELFRAALNVVYKLIMLVKLCYFWGCVHT